MFFLFLNVLYQTMFWFYIMYTFIRALVVEFFKCLFFLRARALVIEFFCLSETSFFLPLKKETGSGHLQLAPRGRKLL